MAGVNPKHGNAVKRCKYAQPMRSTGMVLAAGKAAQEALNKVVVQPASDNTGLYILIAAIVTVVGSIVVAFIAADTAGKRQAAALASSDRQHDATLRAQAEQHKESVAAERERLTARLASERNLQDVRHLREFLDDVAMVYERAARAVTVWSAYKKPPANTETVISDARQAAYPAVVEVGVALDRVALRFGEEHPVYQTYKRLDDLLDKRETVVRFASTPMSEEENEKSVHLGGQIIVAFTAFAAAARIHIGAAAAAADREAAREPTESRPLSPPLSPPAAAPGPLQQKTAH